MGSWCGQMGVGGWVSMVVLWAAVVGLAVWAVSRMFPAQAAHDPRALLETRLASGEISPETYRSIRDELDARARATNEGLR